MSRAVPFCTARGVCWMEVLCCATEHIGKPAQQPIKRTTSPTLNPQFVEDGNKGTCAKKRESHISSPPGNFRNVEAISIREMGLRIEIASTFRKLHGVE